MGTHYTCASLSDLLVLTKHELCPKPSQMWQSRVEIKHYSVVYFDHIAVFDVL